MSRCRSGLSCIAYSLEIDFMQSGLPQQALTLPERPADRLERIRALAERRESSRMRWK